LNKIIWSYLSEEDQNEQEDNDKPKNAKEKSDKKKKDKEATTPDGSNKIPYNEVFELNKQQTVLKRHLTQFNSNHDRKLNIVITTFVFITSIFNNQ